jgi:hypothetical protein
MFLKPCVLHVANASRIPIHLAASGMRAPCTDKLADTGVNLRHINLLRRAVGSSSNPVLFKNIQNRVWMALQGGFSASSAEVQKAITEIIEQIRSDLEMLKGTCANNSGDNSGFSKEFGRSQRPGLGIYEGRERSDRDGEGSSNAGWIFVHSNILILSSSRI